MIPSKNNTCLVSIERKSVVSGEYNDTISWVEDRKAWVSIQPDRGREVFAAGERQVEVTHTVRGDFLELDGVTEEMRIVYTPTHVYSPAPPDDARVFDIVAPMPNFDHRDDTMLKVVENGRRYSQLDKKES